MSLLDTGVKPAVYALASFPASGKDAVREYTELVEVTDPLEIMPGIYTTGEVSTHVAEQALIVETAQGAVILTGCSHPGVVDMVRRAREVVESEIALVTGGFHLIEASRAQIEGIIADLQDLGVQRAAPSHFSGDLAMEMFAEVFGSDLWAGADHHYGRRVRAEFGRPCSFVIIFEFHLLRCTSGKKTYLGIPGGQYSSAPKSGTRKGRGS